MALTNKTVDVGTFTAVAGGGTFYINTGSYQPGQPSPDNHTYYVIEAASSIALTANITITTLGDLYNNLKFTIKNEAVITTAGTGFSLTILGTVIPEELTTSPFIVEALYDSTAAAWVTTVSPDFSSNEVVGTAKLKDTSVTTAKLLDANVTLAKIQNVAANSVLVRDANSSGALTEKAVATTQILIGDGTGFTAAALSGDVTMTNAGVVTLAANSVVTADITDANVTTAKILDANITAGKLATDSVTLPKLASTGSLGSLYAAVGTDAATTEKTLWNVTVGAAQLGATGESIEVVAFGSTAANGNDKTIKLTIDGINVVTSGTLTSNNKIWCLRGLITRTGSNTCWMSGSITVDGVVTDIQTVSSGTMTTAWTSAVALAITGQNGTATGNDIVLNHASAKYIA